MKLEVIVLTPEGDVWAKAPDTLIDVEQACDYAAKRIRARWEVRDTDTDTTVATGCGEKRLS